MTGRESGRLVSRRGTPGGIPDSRVLKSGRIGGTMLAPQNISVYLNNALKPTEQLAELDQALPDVIREMPEEIHGHFVDLDAGLAHEMESAWKRVMILNST